MSEGRLRMRSIYELEVLLAGLLGCRLLIGEAHLVSGHWLELCRNQSINLHSRYIRNFSITGVLLFLLSILDC